MEFNEHEPPKEQRLDPPKYKGWYWGSRTLPRVNQASFN